MFNANAKFNQLRITIETIKNKETTMDKKFKLPDGFEPMEKLDVTDERKSFVFVWDDGEYNTYRWGWDE